MQYIEKIGYSGAARIRSKIESIEYYPFHLHDDSLEIICVLNGTIKISDASTSYVLSYGDIHIFNKNDPHKIESTDSESIILTTHIDIMYYSNDIPDFFDAYFICDTYAERDLYSTDLKHLRFQLSRIYKDYNNKFSDLHLENEAKELIKFLLLNFQQYVYLEDENHPANIVRLQNTEYLYENYDRMYRIVDYVMEHFKEKIYLSTIAEMEYLCESYLSTYIKKTLGLSFSQLVSLTRCEEAAKLLSSTKKTVDQIAQDVGFSSRKHLSTQFKKWYQQTPAEYRNEILKDLKAGNRVKLRTFDYNFANVILDMYLDEY